MDTLLSTGLTDSVTMPMKARSNDVPRAEAAGESGATSAAKRPVSALVETYAPLPIELVSGTGARVVDSTGKAYWDFYGGHAVALLGHAHPAVTAAVARQAGTLTFYSTAAPLAVRSLAADRLAAFAPEPLQRVFFCNSGTEANEHALQIAIRRTGRRTIAALDGAFHGRTLLSVSATGDPKLHQPLGELLAPTVRLRPNEVADLARLTDAVAAVIVEPILSTAGIVELSPAYLTALRRRCDELGILLIYDEVQTGMGRLGRPFAAGRFDVLPDLVTIAKGMANGIPMGAVLMTPEIAAGIALGAMGSTFGGGPVACAALLAVLETLEREGVVRHAGELGARMRSSLRVGPVTEVLGQGCLIGLRVRGAAKAVQSALLKEGFVVGTSAAPDVVRLLPPLNLPFEAIDDLRTALAGMGSSI